MNTVEKAQYLNIGIVIAIAKKMAYFKQGTDFMDDLLSWHCHTVRGNQREDCDRVGFVHKASAFQAILDSAWKQSVGNLSVVSKRNHHAAKA